MPIAEVEPRTTLLSMRVNGVIDPGKLTRADIAAEAVSWGLATTDVESVVDRVLKDLEKGIRIASTAYPAATARHEAKRAGKDSQTERVPGIEMALIQEQGRRCVQDATLRDASLFLTPPPPVRALTVAMRLHQAVLQEMGLILPWVMVSVQFSAGVVRCRLR